MRNRSSSRRNAKMREVKRREALLDTGRKVSAQVARDFHDVEAFPFSAVRNERGKRVISSEETMRRIMSGNKRYKPGD